MSVMVGEEIDRSLVSYFDAATRNELYLLNYLFLGVGIAGLGLVAGSGLEFARSINFTIR